MPIESKDVNRFVREKVPNPMEVQHILSLSKEEIIAELIFSKGGYVYRAFLLERLLEILDEPQGIIDPELYQKAITIQ